MDAAIQNLEFIRQLINEVRQEPPQMDIERLRMLYGYGLGTDALTVAQEDR